MTITIDKEDREVIGDLINSLLLFKRTLLQLSFALFVELKRYVLNFIISLGEFSPKEIQEHGLEDILLKRALRFFGLDTNEGRIEKGSNEENKKLTIKLVVKKVVNLLLSPIYLLILICLYFRNKNYNKNVKNSYKT
jgi:hypothetical protein